MRAVIFDLDDTLYPEMDFVQSGFRAVAGYLSKRYSLDEDVLFKRQTEILDSQGRGKVFDTLLHDIGLEQLGLVQTLVLVYRSHHPRLQLYRDVSPVLAVLRRHKVRLGLITDGMASVQRSKIDALRLSSRIHAIVCTDELGSGYGKPSTVPYQVVLNLLRIRSAEAVYVGDNPGKDFAGARAIGLRMIRVRRRRHKGIKEPRSSEDADTTINSLHELVPIVVGP